MWYYNYYYYMIIIAIITILILHLGKLRHREVKYITQGHTTKKVWIWQSNPGSLAPDSVPLTIIIPFSRIFIYRLIQPLQQHNEIHVVNTILPVKNRVSKHLTPNHSVNKRMRWELNSILSLETELPATVSSVLRPMFQRGFQNWPYMYHLRLEF